MPFENSINTFCYSPASPPPPEPDTASLRRMNNVEYEAPNIEVPYSSLLNRQKQLSSCIKIAAGGSKLIRIEVYNADQFDNAEKSICHCSAEVCAQHVVSNIFSDDIYIKVKDILRKLQTNVTFM